LELLQHRDDEGLLGDDALEATALLLEQDEPLGLVLFECAVAGAPPIEGLIGDADALCGHRN